MASTNFTVLHTSDGQYKIFPLSAMGYSLVAHCQAHGDDLVFSTYHGAMERAKQMDFAIQNRNGRPWITFASPK